MWGLKQATSRVSGTENVGQWIAATLFGTEVSLCEKCVWPSSQLAQQKLRRLCVSCCGLFGMHSWALFHVRNNPCSVIVTLVAPWSSCTCFDLPTVRLPVIDTTTPETLVQFGAIYVDFIRMAQQLQFGALLGQLVQEWYHWVLPRQPWQSWSYV